MNGDNVQYRNKIYTVYRKKHPLLFSCMTLKKVTNLNENFRQIVNEMLILIA